MANGQYAIEQPRSLLDALRDGYESLIDPQRPHLYSATTPLIEAGRGGRWADGSAGVALAITILPPNSIRFAVGGSDAVDGAVKFISDAIEAGKKKSSVPSAWYGPISTSGADRASPYGLWGALGTAAGQDQDQIGEWD